MSSEPRLKLIKFGGEFCPPCKSMDKAQTLEKFIQKHPNVMLVKHDVANKFGETPPGSVYASAEKLSQDYEVTALPTLIFETVPDDGKEPEQLIRSEGALSDRDLEKMYALAKQELDDPGSTAGDENIEEEEEGDE